MPRSRQARENATSSSHVGQEVAGIAQRQLEEGGAERSAERTPRCSACGTVGPSVSRANSKPWSSRGPSPSCRSRWESAGIATRREPPASHQTRSIACCAMTPLGNIAAAGIPSRSATRRSRAATGPCSP